jgi:uncharacterized membrane protein
MSAASIARAVGQVGFGALLLVAGAGHLRQPSRQGFQSAVPDWLPLDKDAVVVASGVAELGLGAALLATWRQPARARVGVAAAAFLVAVFPGNVWMYTARKSVPGMDTDAKRLARLPLQVPLVVGVLAVTDACRTLRGTCAR